MHRFIHSEYSEPEPDTNRQILPAAAQAAVLFISLFCVTLSSCAHRPPKPDHWSLCPKFEIHGEIEPSLSDVEKNLVCGDPKQEEWANLPRWQAEYNLKNFLQERALYRPKFVSVSDTLTRVDVGEPTIVKSVTSENLPDEVDLSRRRFLIGRKMTPALMNDMEGWVGHELKVYGYPCPKVKAEGDPETGELRMKVVRGPLQMITREIEQEVPGMNAGVLQRFHAFGFGDRYDENLVTLSSQRIMRQGLFDSDYFTTTCEADGASLKENVVVGAPRLISFGAGIDTEGYVKGRASWSNTRLGRKASVFSATISASAIYQNINFALDWYAFDAADRKLIRPSFVFLHDNETSFETAQATAQLAFQKTWEWPISKGVYTLGPEFQQIHTFRGTGPSNSRFLMLTNQLEFMSHSYELYLNDPRSGFDLSGTVNFSKEGIVTTITAQRIGFHYDALFNVLNKEPPLLIIGLRGSMDTTVASAMGLQQGGDARLPPPFTYFLGGSQNLRGFGRLSLPRSGVGGLTSAFSDVETRFVQVLPLDIQPFAFFDAGALGPLPGTLRDPIYYSPGLGVRWAPPIGSFRTTLARGYPLDAPGGWQFYFSFGEEF